MDGRTPSLSKVLFSSFSPPGAVSQTFGDTTKHQKVSYEGLIVEFSIKQLKPARCLMWILLRESFRGNNKRV